MLPSSEWKPSAPAMADLSWLNPTPHAIAVYASQPLSPVAPQHSLPSGRYPLLGPGFHRLDRTSLRLAHSFNHLVGDGEQRRRTGETELSGSPVDDDQLEPGRLHDRQVYGLCAVDDAAGIDTALAIRVPHACSVAHEPPDLDKLTLSKHCRYSVTRRQLGELDPPTRKKGAAADHQSIGSLAQEGGEGLIDLAAGVGV